MCAFETHVNLSILSFHYAIGILYILLKCVEITLDTQHKTVTVIQLHCIIKGFSQKNSPGVFKLRGLSGAYFSSAFFRFVHEGLFRSCCDFH